MLDKSFLLRTESATYAQMVQSADRAGLSVNRWLNQTVRLRLAIEKRHRDKVISVCYDGDTPEGE